MTPTPDEKDIPTVLTVADIDKFVEYLEAFEIPKKTCSRCSKEFYIDSYGHMFCECDECFFRRVFF